MKIQSKLIAGFSVILTVFLISTLISLWALNSTQESAIGVEKRYRSLKAVEDLRLMAANLSITLLDLINEKNNAHTRQESLTFLTSFKKELAEDRVDHLTHASDQKHAKLFRTSFAHLETMLQIADEKLLPALQQGTLSQRAERQISQQLHSIRAQLLLKLDQIAKHDEQDIDLAEAEDIDNSANAKNMLILMLVFGIALGLAAFFVISRQIMLPIQATVAMLKDMASGDADLSKRIPITSKDELADLAEYFNQFISKLQKTINEIIGSAETSVAVVNALDKNSATIKDGTSEMTAMSGTISSATEQINANMNTMASSSEEASANVNSITAVVEELSANMNTIAAAAEEASVNMSGISDNVTTISKDLETVISKNASELSVSLQDINERTRRAQKISVQANEGAEANQKAMTELSDVTQQIGQILQLVNNIASQTNMLALNATIEAASAGQAGKGFDGGI